MVRAVRTTLPGTPANMVRDLLCDTSPSPAPASRSAVFASPQAPVGMRSPLGTLPPPFPAPVPRVRDNLSLRGVRGRIGVPGAVAAGLLLPTDAVVPPRCRARPAVV